ncbi:MAG TPA: helix-turn-helix transcriptional regulator [Candidatus Sulfopaludibacter sp.]|jgi:DNA-binding PadR family transcriptional regulator|nr:helix-turn-helix transcriptional regulator [Candidatus Sulfopaludibacter sp.]
MLQQLEPPLTPAVFFTLFALAGGEKHGYAIMQETQSLSDGSFRMGPATLYTTLQRLLELDLVAEVAGDGDADSRRRVYALSTTGRALLDAELARVEAMLRKARAMRLRPGQVKS